MECYHRAWQLDVEAPHPWNQSIDLGDVGDALGQLDQHEGSAAARQLAAQLRRRIDIKAEEAAENAKRALDDLDADARKRVESEPLELLRKTLAEIGIK